MFGFLEGKHDPLAPTSVFYGRVAQCFLITFGIVIFSLTLGTFGYHYCGNVDWLDALVNAAMILTGMGPVDKMETTQGKLFAVFYCLYSGIAFLSLVAILMAPIYHRFQCALRLSTESFNSRIKYWSIPATIFMARSSLSSSGLVFGSGSAPTQKARTMQERCMIESLKVGESGMCWRFTEMPRNHMLVVIGGGSGRGGIGSGSSASSRWKR